MRSALTKALCVAACMAGTIATVAADTCDTEYQLSSAPAGSQFTASEINLILKEHNDARRNVAPMAKTMPMLKWDENLAKLGLAYMSTCPHGTGLSHSSSSYRRNKHGYSYIGENLAAGSYTSYQKSTGGIASTKAWNNELTSIPWTYGCRSSNSCAGAGHYTQVIWAGTTHVGCAYVSCPSLRYKNYWICQYGSGGNIGGSAPYVKTTNVTEAARCQNVSRAGDTPAPAFSASSPLATAASLIATVAVTVAALL